MIFARPPSAGPCAPCRQLEQNANVAPHGLLRLLARQRRRGHGSSLHYQCLRCGTHFVCEHDPAHASTRWLPAPQLAQREAA